MECLRSKTRIGLLKHAHNNNDSLSIYYMTVLVLSLLHASSHLIVTALRICSFTFTDKKPKAEES